MVDRECGDLKWKSRANDHGKSAMNIPVPTKHVVGTGYVGRNLEWMRLKETQCVVGIHGGDAP